MREINQLIPNTESRSIAHFFATKDQTHFFNKRFATDFISMVRNPLNKGVLTPHFFHGVTGLSNDEYSQLVQDGYLLLSLGFALEHKEKQAEKDSDNPTPPWNKDHSVTSYALENGLADKLPPGFIKFVSYGGGDINTFRGNELQIMDAVFKIRGEDFTEFCAVDLLEYFAMGQAITARTRYGLASHAILGDFTYNNRLAIPKISGSTVVMIFGGHFENTPYIEGGNLSPQDTTALAWAKLNLQHNLGTTVIKTCDTNQSPDLVNGPYAPSKNFEAFLLSAFARATQQGVIEDPQYDVFERWKMTSAFNKATQSIELSATCKIDHDVVIGGKPCTFKQGEGRVITLSHKWDADTHIALANRAGFDVEIYREPGNQNIMMVAQAVRWPDQDLMRHIPR